MLCPGCGLELESEDDFPDERYNASAACRRLYDELAAFTQTSSDKDFIHQIAIDSHTAQHIGPKLKPIGRAFALIGLCMVFERGYTGRRVQLAHMALAKTHCQWRAFTPPKGRAALTVADVVNGLNQENYRRRINAWGKAVWEMWAEEHERVTELIDRFSTV